MKTVFELIEANGLTLHGDIEHFAELVRADALAAPVQEPDLIARLKHPENYYEFTDPKKANAVLMSLCQEAADALAAPVQSCYCPNCEALSKELAAAQRQWVGLTDEERDDLLDTYITAEGRAQAIEAKLKEKNT
jgi:hypothetical protein